MQINALLFCFGDLMNNLKQKYINSAVLLLLSSVLVKAISAVYKIPLTSYIGATGRGYFNVAYNIYMPVHAVIMGAFPIALSHLVSKYNQQGNKAKIVALRKSSKILFFLLGVAGTLLTVLVAKPYAQIVAAPKSIYTVYVLAPTVLFSAICASNRSLAEGFMNMVPTAVSQVAEAVFKLVFGLLFAKYSMGVLYDMYVQNGFVLGIYCESEQTALSVIYPLTSAAAMGGVTVGEFAAAVYTGIYNSVKYSDYKFQKKYGVGESMAEIFSFSAPIIISTLIQSVSTFLDSSSVQYFLTYCNENTLYSTYENCIKISNTSKSDLVTYVFGLYSSAQDFKNLIPGLTMALGVAAVPAISAGYESNNFEKFNSLVNSIFKYTCIIAFGGGCYLSLVSKSLLSVLYEATNYDIVLGVCKLVEYYGFTIIFYCFAGISVFAVQAIGFANKSIFAVVISAVCRIAINYFLVSNENVNIYGTVVSGAVGYLIICVCNSVILKKYSGIKFNYFKLIVMPLVCSFFSFFITQFVFRGLFSGLNNFACFVTLSAIFVVCFTVLLILSKTIEFSELKFLQYSKKTV